MNLDPVLALGPILFWAIAIGSEYAIQWLPTEKKTQKTLLNIVALVAFVIALAGEVGAYFYAEIPAEEWFHAHSNSVETFMVSSTPTENSTKVRGKAVTVSTPLTDTDQVTIEYLRRRW